MTRNPKMGSLTPLLAVGGLVALVALYMRPKKKKPSTVPGVRIIGFGGDPCAVVEVYDFERAQRHIDSKPAWGQILLSKVAEGDYAGAYAELIRIIAPKCYPPSDTLVLDSADFRGTLGEWMARDEEMRRQAIEQGREAAAIPTVGGMEVM